MIAPCPPGMPAPMPVVPTSIITAAPSESIASNIGRARGSSTAKCCMMGWKWKPTKPYRFTALPASSATFFLNGSSAPQHWMMRFGWRFHMSCT
jgi:hypothetical protein